MLLNRQLQKTLLSAAAVEFPAPLLPGFTIDLSDRDVVRNLVYLEQHELVTLSKARLNNGHFAIGSVEATAKGMDFLQKDGGLSAILGVVTVRLHDDTIKDLLSMKIQDSDLPPAEKQRWIDQLRELPAETTKHIVLKLVDLGLEKAPDALSTIGRLIGLGL